MHITRDEILMNRDRQYPLTPELEANLAKLLECLNKFREIYGKPMEVTSGYRPEAVNSQVSNAAKNSSHVVCMACDFADVDGSLDKYCLKNIQVLIDCGLYLENPVNTPGWCHLQIRPTKIRVFNP